MLKTFLATLALVVFVGLGVACSEGGPSGRSDAQIRQDVSSSLDAANIQGVVVSVSNGVVTLTGSVADQAALDRAVELARAANGVASVESKVQVASAGGGVDPAELQTPDGVLMARVQLKLQANTALAGSTITPAVKDGVVVLTGSVPSEAAKTLAEKETAAIEGVKTVTNQLQVAAKPAPVADVPDDQLKDTVDTLLDQRFSDLSLFAKVKDGIVSVSGAVPNRARILEVAQAIGQIPGVKAVETKNLTVLGGEPENERIGAPSNAKKS